MTQEKNMKALLNAGKAAWERIEENSPQMREDWVKVGAALSTGRNLVNGSGDSFEAWCESVGFGSLPGRRRADAIWLAQHEEELERLLHQDTEAAGVDEPGKLRSLVRKCLGSQKHQILALVQEYPELTRDEIAGRLGLVAEQVRRRLSELKARGKIVEGVTRTCEVTGKEKVTYLAGSVNGNGHDLEEPKAISLARKLVNLSYELATRLSEITQGQAELTNESFSHRGALTRTQARRLMKHLYSSGQFRFTHRRGQRIFVDDGEVVIAQMAPLNFPNEKGKSNGCLVVETRVRISPEEWGGDEKE